MEKISLQNEVWIGIFYDNIDDYRKWNFNSFGSLFKLLHSIHSFNCEFVSADAMWNGHSWKCSKSCRWGPLGTFVSIRTGLVPSIRLLDLIWIPYNSTIIHWWFIIELFNMLWNKLHFCREQVVLSFILLNSKKIHWTNFCYDFTWLWPRTSRVDDSRTFPLVVHEREIANNGQLFTCSVSPSVLFYSDHSFM